VQEKVIRPPGEYPPPRAAVVLNASKHNQGVRPQPAVPGLLSSIAGPQDDMPLVLLGHDQYREGRQGRERQNHRGAVIVPIASRVIAIATAVTVAAMIVPAAFMMVSAIPVTVRMAVIPPAVGRAATFVIIIPVVCKRG